MESLPLYTATLIGAETLPAAVRQELQSRFVRAVDHIFGGHAAAARSLHHWEDGGVDLIEPTPWPQAVRQVTAHVLACVEVPAAARFKCELTDAAYSSEPDDERPHAPNVEWPAPEHEPPF